MPSFYLNKEWIMDGVSEPEKVTVVEKVEFDHYRVPFREAWARSYPRRGKPINMGVADLYRYSPKYGWNSEYTIDDKPFPRGGKTVCLVTLSDGRKAEGVALCSMADQFCYRIGRDISKGRAMHALGVG